MSFTELGRSTVGTVNLAGDEKLNVQKTLIARYGGEDLHLKYRSDIDGLRGIAVLLVVLFHCGIERFSGGYIGVDVFFVLSGYLITSIILSEIDSGSFSISGFYLRRIKRLLPAYFAMLLLVSVVSFILFTPKDLSDYAQSAISSTLYFSNVYFWRTTDYFSISAEFQPLLHTWSLSIEEQFYLLTPLFAALAARTRRIALVLLLGLSLIASFALCYFVFVRSELAGFYLLPTRAWELLCGSMIAAVPRHRLGEGIIVEALKVTGLLAIFVPALTLQKGGLSPSEYAVLPCLGTAMLIYLGNSKNSFVGSLLGSTVLVWIGLISYSLYLWHWPILAMYRYLLGSVELGATSIIICIFLSLVLASLSWRFVETPFRRGKLGSARPQTLFSLACAATVFAIIPLTATWMNGGTPQRYPPDLRAFVEASAIGNSRRSDCFDRSPADTLCFLGSTTQNASVLIWGDSYADAAFPGFHSVASELEVTGVFAGSSGCPPLPHVHANKGCKNFNDEVIDYIEANASIHRVVLVSRWHIYNVTEELSDKILSPGIFHSERYVFSDSDYVDPHTSNKRILAASLDELVDYLTRNNIDVHIVYGLPEYTFDVPRRLLMQKRWGLELPAQLGKSEVDQIFYDLEQILLDLEARYHQVQIHNLSPLLCNDTCLVERAGLSLYRDGNHLSEYGSVTILRSVFEEILKR